MKMSQNQFRRLVSACSLCLVMIIFLNGCAPLRKNFIRQKKKDKAGTEDFVPVLEPEVYPVKKTGPGDVYAQQYSMFNLWISDFADNFDTMNNNDKRMINDLDAALKSISEMIRLVKTPASEELSAIKGQVQYIRDEFAKQKSFRNPSRIKSELRDVDKKIRKNFKVTMVKEFLVTE